MSKFVAGALAIGLVSCAGIAGAASLEVVDAGGAVRDLGGLFDLDNSPAYSALVSPGAASKGDAVTVFTGAAKTGENGLFLTQRSRVTFTYLGSEAAFTNFALDLLGDTVLFRNNGDGATAIGATSASFVFDSGFLPFAFQSFGVGQIDNNGFATGGALLELAFSALFNDGNSVVALFGDTGANVDGDLDDLGVRIDVAPVPLPAAAWLLLSAFGGLGWLSRKRRAHRVA